jgi:predicted molibdopterin-dependent oxidoreductase YjgC
VGEQLRILNHPILGIEKERHLVKIFVDGRELYGYEDEPIAAMLIANGIKIHRFTTKKHEPRGVFCAIGRCTDCVMMVNDVPNVRTCVTPLQTGMRIETQQGAGFWGDGDAKV